MDEEDMLQPNIPTLNLLKAQRAHKAAAKKAKEEHESVTESESEPENPPPVSDNPPSASLPASENPPSNLNQPLASWNFSDIAAVPPGLHRKNITRTHCQGGIDRSTDNSQRIFRYYS